MTDDLDLRLVLGRNVRRLRRHRKLTQKQLAQRSKLTERTIIAIEKAEHGPNQATIELLARALGKPVEALLHDRRSYTTTTRCLRMLLSGASAQDRKAILAYARRLLNPPDSTTSSG
jgi:transcriptional regulator with XRE-family HTH domain